jgi:XTP/dITP diphosphohydrolase
MKKLLYGTTNPAKLKFMREMLQGLGLQIIGLKDIDIEIEAVDEIGNNPLENAKIKALAYYKSTNMAVFSCDTGLYIEGISNDKQPGVHVRRVDGKELSDEEMIKYYTELAKQHGGTVKAKYKNAIVLILDDNRIFEYDGEDISYSEFLLTSEVHPNRTKGFPLDSISLEIKTKQYFMDIEAEADNDDNSITKGFQGFFQRTILK